jgi:hypothetical protein
MFGIPSFILLALPLLFQIIFGRKAIRDDIKVKFGTICLVSFVLQILLFFISFSIASTNQEKRIAEEKFACGMEITGTIVFSLLFSFFLLIAIIIQNSIKKSYAN